MTKKTKPNLTKKDQEIHKLITRLFKLLGEDPKREGLKGTPRRITELYKELLSGYRVKPESIFKYFNDEKYSGLITVSNINFYSLCEHHMLPFFGKVHIGYVPNGKILGLSKFARLVDIFSRRFQLQERLTKQIADSLAENLHPKGVIVLCEAEHLCMSMRGTKKSNCIFRTLVKSGKFQKDEKLVRQYFLQIDSKKKQL